MQGCPSSSIAMELYVISYRMLARRPAVSDSASPSVLYNSTKVTLNLSDNGVQTAWNHAHPAVSTGDSAFHQRRLWGWI